MSTCRCINSVWNPDKNTCDINCNSVTFATGPLAGTSDQCVCQSPYYFNPEVGQCIKNCSTVYYSQGNNPGMIATCLCVSGFYYDSARG